LLDLFSIEQAISMLLGELVKQLLRNVEYPNLLVIVIGKVCMCAMSSCQPTTIMFLSCYCSRSGLIFFCLDFCDVQLPPPQQSTTATSNHNCHSSGRRTLGCGHTLGVNLSQQLFARSLAACIYLYLFSFLFRFILLASEQHTVGLDMFVLGSFQRDTLRSIVCT
jgi:hypothetical protein